MTVNLSRRAVLASGASVMLGACSTVNMEPVSRPPSGLSSEEAYARRLARLESLVDWQVRGRMALKTADDSASAGVRWQQTGERYLIALSNPLGQTIAQLRGAPGRVSLRTSEGEDHEARSPEGLLQRVTGLTMPVSAMRHWLLGRPDPAAATEVLDADEQGRPVFIAQSGWKIDYDGYSNLEGLELPTRVTLERNEVRVKLALRGWEA